VKLTFLKGVALGSVVASVTLTATSAMAGTGIGAVFNLGKTNRVDATSHLTGKASGSMLALTNTGAGPALGLKVGNGIAPFSVNSSTQVANLNASLLGGLAPTNFVQGGGEAHAYALTLNDMTPTNDVPLLSIPGYGTIRVACGQGGVDLFYLNGTHTVTFWKTTPAGTSVTSVAPSGIGPIALGSATERDELMIQYITSSGLFLAQHVATADVAFEFDGSTCNLVADELSAAGRIAP
jgi:hypothetical protein